MGEQERFTPELETQDPLMREIIIYQEDPGRDIAEGLREARRERRINQSELARAIGVTNRYINYIERDHRLPKLSTLLSIAKQLQVEIVIKPASKPESEQV